MPFGVKESECALGFAARSGQHQIAHKGSLIPIIRELWRGIDNIKRKYVREDQSQLRSDRQFRQDVEDLFTRLGPKLWPSEVTTDPATWLADPKEDDLGGLWPQALTYAGDEQK
jgi:hypothetical protein